MSRVKNVKNIKNSPIPEEDTLHLEMEAKFANNSKAGKMETEDLEMMKQWENQLLAQIEQDKKKLAAIETILSKLDRMYKK